jgi:membrane protease YdiL (CAAX protease family)
VNPDARAVTAVAGLVVLLLLVHLWVHRATARSRVVGGPVVALLLLAFGLAVGLSWADLGLAPESVPAGVAVGLVAGAVVAVGYGVALAVPRVRRAIRDERYRMPPLMAARTALVVVPLATVLPEEVAFRGVLWGQLAQWRGELWATVGSAALFGLWHVLPALEMARRNVLLRGRGGRTALVTIAATVVATALAGVLLAELRRRTGSLLAPIGLHWAVNGLGVIAAAWAWRIERETPPPDGRTPSGG